MKLLQYSCLIDVDSKEAAQGEQYKENNTNNIPLIVLAGILLDLVFVYRKNV